jgi:hypothetical protein
MRCSRAPPMTNIQTAMCWRLNLRESPKKLLAGTRIGVNAVQCDSWLLFIDPLLQQHLANRTARLLLRPFRLRTQNTRRM